MNGFILKENGLLPQGGKRKTTTEQKFWIAVRVFLFCFCFCYFYLVRRLCFSHFITKILRSLQISVYRQNVPYNVLLKVHLSRLLTFSDETKSHPKLFFKGWMMLYTITVYLVDDAIIGFSNTSRCRRDRARKKNKAATVFVLLFQINVSKYSLFSFVVSIIGTL